MPALCARTPRARALLLILTVVIAAVIVPVMPTPAQASPAVRIQTVEVIAQTDAGQATFSSQVIHTRPFAMVGLKVAETDGPPPTLKLRTAETTGPWSDWTDVPLLHEDGPDPGSQEALDSAPGLRTHPVFTDRADRLQVRVEGGTSSDVEALLIDPFGLDRSLTQRMADQFEAAWNGGPQSQADAGADMPQVVTRAQWGSDESIVRGPPSYAPSVERAFVHHTVGSNSYSQAQAAGVVRGVQAYHVNGNGWSDIGYNFLVDRFGTVYEGRAGGMDRAVIGAQAGGFNTSSTGVALMGTFTSATPGTATLDALERVIAWKADIHHFNPLGSGEEASRGSSRFPEGTVVTLDNVSGHRAVSTTTCPGDGTLGRLGEIREQARGYAGDLIVDESTTIGPSTQVIRGTPDTPTATFAGTLDPPAAWTIWVTGPDGEERLRRSGEGSEARAELDLTSGRWTVGEYEWMVQAPGRTPAGGTFTFTPPMITGLVTSRTFVTADADGVLVDPVVFGAELWDDAEWEVEITDPDGAVVHRSSGRSMTLNTGWFHGATKSGTYTVTVTAEDAQPVQTALELRFDLLDRLADTTDPVAAAVAVSAEIFPGGSAEHAVIARQDVFADALAGGPLAGTDGPLLLTGQQDLDARVMAELDRILAPEATVYVLGGQAAIADSVVDALRLRYGDVVRVAGPTRIGTAAAVAAIVLDRSGGDTVMVARAGPDDVSPWADALSGGAFGAYAGIPVLLSDTQRLSPETAAALDDLGVRRTLVLGGAAAISEAVEFNLPAPTRLSGADRTATGIVVAEDLWQREGNPTEVLVVNGYDPTAWAYALAAAPLAARRQAPLVVTTQDHLAMTAAGYLSRHPSVVTGTIVGPPSLVDPEVGYEASSLLRR